MEYDMEAKRAQRLLGRNWASVQAEAHRLGGLGLPNFSVVVEEEVVRLVLKPDTLPRGYWAQITPTEVEGGLLIQWQDGHWENDGPACYGGLEAVSTILQEALEEVVNLGQRMTEVREELAKVK